MRMSVSSILGRTREEILRIDPKKVGILTAEEVLHIASVLGAFWQYDYNAARAGRPGYHALLKSGRHSDGFLVSKILLESPLFLEIFADQIVYRLWEAGQMEKPDFVAGIPDGASRLGEKVADIFGTSCVPMEKRNGSIHFSLPVPYGSGTLLFVEDFCTRGTGFREAVRIAGVEWPASEVLPYYPVIVNRGGLDEAEEAGRFFRIIPVVTHQIDDWAGEACPLCKSGSLAIPPKASPENWRLIVDAQKG